MTEWELDQICEHTACDCKCGKCPIWARYWNSQLGCDEEDYE